VSDVKSVICVIAKLFMAQILLTPIITKANNKLDSADYQIYNFSRYAESVSKFSVRQISVAEIGNHAPPEVVSSINLVGVKHVFLLIAPEQVTAGYNFEITRHGSVLTACLKKPSKDQMVLMVVTNPVAVLLTSKDYKITIASEYCQ
jgi:hypothetical protein